MKNIALALGITLILTANTQAAVTPTQQKPCASIAVVQKALDKISLTDVKNQMADQLKLPRNRVEMQHKFNFEGQRINRWRRIGNQCVYYIAGSNDPIYSIRD
jgi:hypothetical protein